MFLPRPLDLAGGAELLAAVGAEGAAALERLGGVV